MPLDSAIGPVFTPYCPGGRHGHQFRRKKSSCAIVEIAFRAFKRHKTDPLFSSSKQQAAWKAGMPRLKPKSTDNFVAIKR
jgi:hypothetical protein